MTAIERINHRRHKSRSNGYRYSGLQPETMDYYSLDRRRETSRTSRSQTRNNQLPLDYTSEFNAMDYCSMDRRLNSLKKSKYKYMMEDDDSSDDTLEYMELFIDDFDE